VIRRLQNAHPRPRAAPPRRVRALAPGPRRLPSPLRAEPRRRRGPVAHGGPPRQAGTAPASRHLPHHGVPRRRRGLHLPGDRLPHANTGRDGDVAAAPRPPAAARPSPGLRCRAPFGPDGAGRARQGWRAYAGPVMTARAQASRAGARPVTATAAAHRAGLAWPRLPAAAELATIGAGYGAYALVRLAIRAGRHAAFGHAAWLWRAERRMHLTIEPYLNHGIAGHPALAEMTGYYYGLVHFLATALLLAWLYVRRPA